MAFCIQNDVIYRDRQFQSLVERGILDTISELARPDSLTDHVAAGLRQAILQGRLQPGARIRQQEGASQFGTSRIPVREALRSLASEGLVTLEPDVGARVAELDLDELVELYLMRERLEPMVLAESAQHMSLAQIHSLRALVSEMHHLTTTDHHTKWSEADRQFHFQSYQAAGLKRALRLIESFWNTTQPYRHLYRMLPGRFELANSEHLLIVEALERQAAADAADLLLIHIRRTRLTLASRPDLFRPLGVATL